MDPTACLRRFLGALDDDDTAEAIDAAADLHNWLARGGFPPEMTAEELCALWGAIRGLCRAAHVLESSIR